MKKVDAVPGSPVFFGPPADEDSTVFETEGESNTSMLVAAPVSPETRVWESELAPTGPIAKQAAATI